MTPQNVQEWALLSAVPIALYIVSHFYGLWIFETATSLALATFNPGVLPKSKSIQGPKWQYPNGTVIERFLNGRKNSEKWQQYGPVYRVWSGLHPEIVITTPEDLKHFASDANDHPKNPNVNLGWYVGELLGQAMGLLWGPDWKRLRKIFDPAFTHSAAVARIETVDGTAQKFIDGLSSSAFGAAAPGKSEGDKASFDIPVLGAFTKFPYFLTASVIYGPMTEEEESELWRITENRTALNRYWIVGGVYRVETTAKLFDKQAVRHLREFNEEWQEYNARLVKVRRERGDVNLPIIAYWEELENGNISATELLQTLDELLMLNLDVITHVVTWFITLVATHEDVQRELRDEVAANEADLCGYLVKTDTHLHRCFVESMRVRPFSVFTIGESSSAVKDFHGVLVKPNTQILVDVLAINVRNPFWGPNSQAFDPSRLMNMKPGDLRYNLHSFGIGSRKCMGQYIAGHIVKSLVSHLFARYEVRLVDEAGGAEANGSAGGEKGWTPKSEGTLRLTPRTQSRAS